MELISIERCVIKGYLFDVTMSIFVEIELSTFYSPKLHLTRLYVVYNGETRTLCD